MQYVLLIYSAEARFADSAPEEGKAIMEAYGTYTKELFATAKAGDCAALEATHTATSVRVREGKRAVQDGPFAETREQLGGYYTIDAKSEDEALEWAAKIPGARFGRIEVRPIPQMPASGSDAKPSAFTNATHKEYLLLIYDAESVRTAMSDADRGAMFRRYIELTKDLRASGHFIAGDPLAPAATAKTVTNESGRRVVRDGPFAETREQLGGYYRVWAKDLDEAIALAAKIPAVEFGTIEVRPVMDTRAYA